jgi:hypothetical protein
MTASSQLFSIHPSLKALHADFLALLPRIEDRARFAFRHIVCPHQRDEAVADVVALAWSWYCRLAHKGRNAGAFISKLAVLAARQVKAGRSLGGQEKAQDVLSWRAQRRHGFTVGRLADFSTVDGGLFAEALADNTQTPPPDAAAFRIDWPRWLARRTHRDRRLIHELARGERTRDVARKFHLSPARVSQKRRQFHQDWLRFHGEDTPWRGRRGIAQARFGNSPLLNGSAASAKVSRPPNRPAAI